MPIIHDGGGPGGPPERVLTFHTVALDPEGTGGETTVVVQTGTVTQAVQEANKTVKTITVGQPSVGNLPSNAEVGAMYQFASNPATIYVYGPDNIWRALVLTTVT